MQLRTRLQHAWSTAVEAVDTFEEGDLKFGGGDPNWRRYFQLTGSAIASIEGTALVPGTPTNISDLRGELRDLEDDLQVKEKLGSWATATRHIKGIKSGANFWHVLEIDPVTFSTSISSFAPSLVKEAVEAYQVAEKRRSGKRQVVLVSINSLRNLEKAFPNYFGDTALFSSTVNGFIEPSLRPVRRAK